MPLLVYTVLRVAVLAACLGVGFLLGLRGWFLAAAVVVVAALVSYIALPRPRAAAAAYLAERAQRRGRSRFAEGLDADAAAEDRAAEGRAVEGRAVEGDAGEPGEPRGPRREPSGPAEGSEHEARTEK